MNRKQVLEKILVCLQGTKLKYEVKNKGSGDHLVQFDANQEDFQEVAILEESLAEEGITFDTGYETVKQLRIWNLDSSLTVNGKTLNRTSRKTIYRKQVLEEILDRLQDYILKYEVEDNGSNDLLVQFDTNQENFEQVEMLEKFFTLEGILFDIGNDTVKQLRIWKLDSSLKVNGKTPNRKSPPKRINYAVGDVIQVPLDDGVHKGYGRILTEKAPLIFMEFYKVVSKEDLPLEKFHNLDWFLRLYTGDMGLVREKTWKVLGNIPVGEFSMPLFWLKGFDDNTYLLFKDPLHIKDQKKTTLEEIIQLRAQYGGVAGHKAMEGYLSTQLRNEFRAE